MKKDKKSEALAQKYISFYRRAFYDKAAKKIGENIKKFDDYWEGNVNLPKSESDPGSCVNIIHPTIEGQVALLTEQNIGISVLPVTPSELPYAKNAAIALDFIRERNRIVPKIEMHERRREKYGTGIFRVTFDPDALGGAGLPIISPCENQNVFIDPCVTDYTKINDAEFIIETMVKSVYWARQAYGEQIAQKIRANYFPEAGEDIFDEQSAGAFGDNDKYLHMLIWTREGGILRLVEMTGCGIILSDSFENGKENYFPGGRYPYFFTPLYRREGSIWGKGDVELLIPLQDLINDLDDQIRISARLTGNPQRLIATSSGIDLEALTNEAGLNIPTNDINAVRNIEPPTLPAYIENRRNLALQYEVQKISRFSDQMTGSKQAGVNTATEALALQQGGSTGINHKKVLLQETLGEVFSYCLEMIREYWTDDVPIRLEGRERDFIYFNGSVLKKIDNLDFTPDGAKKAGVKNAEFDVIVKVGAGMPTNKSFVYSMMLELYKAGLVTAAEVRKWLVEMMGVPVSAQMPERLPASLPIKKAAAKNADIEGLTKGGKASPSGLKGGEKNV